MFFISIFYYSGIDYCTSALLKSFFPSFPCYFCFPFYFPCYFRSPFCAVENKCFILIFSKKKRKAIRSIRCLHRCASTKQVARSEKIKIALTAAQIILMDFYATPALRPFYFPLVDFHRRNMKFVEVYIWSNVRKFHRSVCNMQVIKAP